MNEEIKEMDPQEIKRLKEAIIVLLEALTRLTKNKIDDRILKIVKMFL